MTHSCVRGSRLISNPSFSLGATSCRAPPRRSGRPALGQGRVSHGGLRRGPKGLRSERIHDGKNILAVRGGDLEIDIVEGARIEDLRCGWLPRWNWCRRRGLAPGRGRRSSFRKQKISRRFVAHLPPEPASGCSQNSTASPMHVFRDIPEGHESVQPDRNGQRG